MKNPWENLQPGILKAISKDILAHDFYWYLEARNNNPCLFYKIKDNKIELPKKNKLPSISYIKFLPASQDYKYLCIELQDKNYVDLFLEYCNLLIKASLEIEDEEVALNVFVKKAWRWQALLSKTREKKLSQEKQKGLIGELFFLDNFLFPRFTKRISVENWFGAKGSKDFEFSRFHIEIKTKRSGSKPTISISSEDQLKIIEGTKLFIAVFGIDKSDSKESFSVHDWCNKMTDKIFNSNDTSVLSDFIEKLNEYGYSEEQDYTDEKWDIKEIIYYQVTDQFPKLVSGEISTAIANVNYSIDMNQLSSFEIPKEELESFLDDVKS
tara:strand:- start:2074 stop:3048 length:975 start_codon:yes stop_codon:yes gene_type:complete